MTNRNISVIECEFKTKVPTNPQQREQQGGEAAGGKDSWVDPIYWLVSQGLLRSHPLHDTVIFILRIFGLTGSKFTGG